MEQSDGPYVNFAVVCEKVLRESDGVLSLIRIVDHLSVAIDAPPEADAPAELVPPVPTVALTFVVGLKSGGYMGSVPVKVRIETPSGSRWPEVETSQQLEGADRGINILLPMQFPAQDEGVYWFVVEVSGAVVTRVPLRISKQVGPQTIPPQD